MKSIRLSLVVAVAVVAVIAGGCGYRTTSRTAKDIKSIHVPFFENDTSEPNLELTVTNQIIQDLIDDNTLDVVGEDRADAVLDGKITEFVNKPFSFDRNLNAQEYRVVIRVKVSLFNRRTNKAIWADQSFSGDGSYFIDVNTGNTFDDAVAEAIKKITDRILNLTVQDW